MGQVKIEQDGAALCKDGENFLLTPKTNKQTKKKEKRIEIALTGER